MGELDLEPIKRRNTLPLRYYFHPNPVRRACLDQRDQDTCALLQEVERLRQELSAADAAYQGQRQKADRWWARASLLESVGTEVRWLYDHDYVGNEGPAAPHWLALKAALQAVEDQDG